MGQGLKLNNDKFEITAAYPELVTYYGLLSGLAYSFSKCLFGMLGGRLTDKYNRAFILGIACLGWSVCTYM